MEVQPANVQIVGDTLTVTFDRFDIEQYRLFIRTKRIPETRFDYDWEQDRYVISAPARLAPLMGLPAPDAIGDDVPLADHLFDYQRWAVEMALRAKRFAIWCDTGLGKGPMGLEWCRQVVAKTGGRVLYLTPLAIIPQVIREAERFYGDTVQIDRIESRDELGPWCRGEGARIGITNYQKFIPKKGEPEVLSDLRYLAGVCADESSVLKTGGGVIKWSLIKSARGIPYKLSLTATPAPNDAMEYASQAAFLETLRHENEILWTYFSRDKYGEWTVKPHARSAYYRFLSTWSLYMRNPAAFGFGDILASLPSPEIHEERIGITDDQRTRMTEIMVKHGAGLFADERLGVVPRSKLAQLARGFIYNKDEKTERVDSLKPARVAEIANTERDAGRQVIIWTAFDEEAEILQAMIPGAAILTGKQPEEARVSALEDFRSGSIRVLISKPQLIGYGLNLQFVRSMVFSGFDDSFERVYQAIRRCYRFGQTETVTVWFPYVPELEGLVFSNVKQKEARFMEEVAEQEANYRDALKETEVAA